MLHRNNPRTTNTVFFIVHLLPRGDADCYELICLMSLEAETVRLRRRYPTRPDLTESEYIAATQGMRVPRHNFGAKKTGLALSD
jgi:hypothetical protein